MIIHNIKINGFGKIENKEYHLNKGINLITGQNECGKTTFAKCIQALFFGISRTKNGKSIADYDKYKPWNNIPFTAKIEYSLDNGERYEVYRDFDKRNTKIFNSHLDDVSADYSIDKNKNSNYFIEQTNISEDIFNNTAIVHQQEVKLDNVEQNIILQKLSNLVSTGNDTVSFTKLMDRLNKKQLDEVGTQRSTERPLNVVLNKIEACENELKDISFIKSKETLINDELANLKVILSEKEKEIELIKELQNIRNNERINLSQIETIQQVIEEYDSKIKEIADTINEIEQKNSRNLKLGILFGLISTIYTIILFIFNLPISLICISIILVLITTFFLFKRLPIPDTKAVLVKAKLEKSKELEKIITDFKDGQRTKNEYIINKYGNNEYLKLSYEQLENVLAEREKSYSYYKLRANTLSINSKSISSQMGKMAETEEQLNSLQEELKDLNFLNNSINIAKSALNEAYLEMKNCITPDFTNYLSNTISKISGGKYNQVKFDDKNGLIVKLENGDYISSELLSIGTIDEMYLALRMATIKETSNEKMPIILDEAFVYFDNERLQNILEFLNKEFEQVIIFSCSDREKKLLDKMNIEYNTLFM